MKEVRWIPGPESGQALDAATFVACLAAILELPVDALPQIALGDDPATDWTLSRWLGGIGLGLVPVAQAASFQWPGPWIARVRDQQSRRSVVMYGVPSGVVWDPAEAADEVTPETIEEGYIVAASDIALALPSRPTLSTETGVVEEIWVAASAGAPAKFEDEVAVLPGQGLEGDRHVYGTGTFPSGLPGSALTLIEAEVCEAFDPPLKADAHRRNLVTRGINLNRLVGAEFTIGRVRCRGTRLCEPCAVIQQYAHRPVLRALVHRAGLRADILTVGAISVGDEVRTRATAPEGRVVIVENDST